MSLIPSLLFSDWWDQLERPHSIDQSFGLGLRPDQLVTPQQLELYLQPLRRRDDQVPNYLRPWAELLREAGKGGSSTIETDKDQYKV